MRKFRVVVNGNTYEVDIEEIATGASIVPSPAAPATVTTESTCKPAAPTPSLPPNNTPKSSMTETEGTIAAQMPGTIVDVRVSAGDQIKRGQPLLILEAMKMENEIVAPHDGSVIAVHVERGASVNAGDALVVLS